MTVTASEVEMTDQKPLEAGTAAQEDTLEQEQKLTQTDLADAAKINFLTDDNTTFIKTAGNMLNVIVDGTEYDSVYVHCSFPHTDKRIYLSIRTHDNKEIGMIRTLDSLSAEAVSLLEEQIGIRYFAPEITKVNKVQEEFGYTYWDTETTSGTCRFTVRGGGNNVKFVNEHRILVLDVDGNRFVIPDVHKMTDKEYRMIEICM